MRLRVCLILGAKKAKAALAGGFQQENPRMSSNPKVSRRHYRTTVDRCLYRAARQRFAQQRAADHRSWTIGRAGQRRPSPLALGDVGHDAA